MNALARRTGPLITLAALAACSSPRPSCPPPPEAGAGRTIDFVVSAITVDDSDSPDVPHTGFDLDGHRSGPTDPSGCNHQDNFSDLDPDQNAPGTECTTARVVAEDLCGGVDNQYPTLAGAVRGVSPDFIANDQYRLDLATAVGLYVLRVSGVDDLANDPHVEITILAAFDADGDCANNFTGAGTFAIDERSFEAGDPARPRWHTCGAIVGGRLRTTVPLTMPVRVAVAPPSVERIAHDAQLRFDIAPDGSRGTRGNWGGRVEAARVIEALEAAYPIMCPPPPTLCLFEPRAIGVGLVDLRRDDVGGGGCVEGTGAAAQLGDISLGYGFEAAPATVIGVSAAPPVPACSGPARPDAGVPDA